MKIRNKTLKFLVFLFVTALIFFVLFRRIDFKEVLIVLSQTDVKLFFLALGISAFACLVAGVEKYKWVLRFFGLSVSSREVRIFKLGSFPLKELMPFKSGEFIRAVFLKRRFDMPYYKGLSAVFTNYFLRIFILGFLSLVSWFYCRGFTRGLVLSLFSLLIFLIFAGKIFKTGIFSVKRHAGGTNGGGLWRFDSKGIYRSFFYSGLLEICLLLNFFILFKAVGINISFSDRIFYFPLIVAASSFPLGLRGLGVREGLIVLVFSQGFSLAGLLAGGLLISLVNELFPTLIGLFYMNSFFEEFAGGACLAENPVEKYLEKRRKNVITKYRIKKRSREIVQVLKTFGARGMELLDIGAADGEMLTFLKSELELKRAVGIEPEARLREANKDTGVLILEGSGEKLPFKSGEFDCVVIASVIEHADDASKLLFEANRVLRPGGIVIISAVNPICDRIAVFFGFKPDDHKRTYGLKKLNKVLTESGFQIKILKRFGPLFYELAAAVKK